MHDHCPKYGLVVETAEVLLREIDLEEIAGKETKEMMRSFEKNQSTIDDIDTSVVIYKDDLQLYWQYHSERTGFSFSELHFGLYKATATSNYLSKAHMVTVQIAMLLGHSYARWQQYLMVMLEKKAGCIVIEKIHAILLVKVDFNIVNKIIIGDHMMLKAKNQCTMPPNQMGA